jgi:hypothetical protein
MTMCSMQQIYSLSDCAFDMELEEDMAPQCAHAESLMHSVWTASEAAAAHASAGWACDLDLCNDAGSVSSQCSLPASPARMVAEAKIAAATPASFECVVNALTIFDCEHQKPFRVVDQNQHHAHNFSA